jgi:peptide/nickel transport system substrate-binding protein
VPAAFAYVGPSAHGTRPKRRAAPSAGLFGCLVSIVALSCTTAGPASTASAREMRLGGTIRVGLVKFWDQYVHGAAPGPVFDSGLDPHVAIGSQAELLRCCLVRTLVSYTGQPTATGGADLRPDLATGLPEVSGDGLTWTFHLKPGLHYGPPLQDTEIVAADVIRGIERSLTPTPQALAALPFTSPHLGSAWYAYAGLIKGSQAFADGASSSIAGLEVPDRYTLRVSAVSATGDVPYLFALADSAPIPPNPGASLARLGAAQGHDGVYGRHLVSSGPYMLEGAEALDFSVPADQQRGAAGYRSGEGFTFVRNPSWDPATDELRPAYADRIEFTTWPSDDAASGAIESGAIDIAWDVIPSAAQVAMYAADQATRRRVISEPNDVVFFAAINLATKPFDDIHVRKALNLVVDKARVRDLAASLRPRFGGPNGGRVASHIVPDGLEDDLLVGYRPYDAVDDHGSLSAARAEIARSAYDTDRDGVCDASACRDIVALVRDDEPFWRGLADVVADGAADLGITFDRRDVGVRELFAKAFEPGEKVPIAFALRYTKDYPTAAGILPGLFSARAIADHGNASLTGATPEQLTRWGYVVGSVPTVDDRLATCQAEIRQPVECWARVDQYLMEQVVPTLPLLFGEATWVVSERVGETSFAQATGWAALDRFVVKPDDR